ncbi:bifunctional 4-hydroxy-2-oxoglutarate aldolase/2-dehydro-3-deoxy-phosphogluconate aldolase [soil metagenome]
MTNQNEIERSGVVAVVRLDDLSDAVAVTQALVAGGVTNVEFTFTNPTAAEAISTVRSVVGDVAYVGAGTVLDPETARIAILAGAQYIVTPTFKNATVEMCRRYSVPTIIGAFTATEMLTAWEAGADYIKVHPAGLGGPKYFKDILGPLPQLRLIPSGGVTLENAKDFIAAGAIAVALGSNLVDGATVKAGDWEEISRRARVVVEAVRAQGNCI